MEEGWGQCLAELIAVQKIFGIVSNGKILEFGQIEQYLFQKNIQEYTISALDKLFSALNYLFQNSQFDLIY